MINPEFNIIIIINMVIMLVNIEVSLTIGKDKPTMLKNIFMKLHKSESSHITF